MAVESYCALIASVLTASALAACDVPPPPARTARPLYDEVATAPADELPPSTPTYATEPTASPLLGGPLAAGAEQQVLEALRARGDRPQGDGRLAVLARWAARRAARGTKLDSETAEAVAWRLGCVSTPYVLVQPRRGSVQHPMAEDDLRKAIAAFPTNIPITRYGIATIARGGEDVIAIVLDSLEVTLQPIPKRLAVNDVLRLSGSIADRFAHARLAITLPDGRVRTWESASRDVKGEWTVTDKGVHRIELLGDGPSGPVVVANFPVYVGVDEPAPSEPAPNAPAANASHAATGGSGDAGALPDPAAVEAEMLALLDEARAAAHLAPVQKDDALAAVARAHSADMQAHAFFGHVSPTTGTPEDRLRAAHLLYAEAGENVVRAGSAREAHESLMESPAHREAMLGKDFTHVGIGAVVAALPTGAPDVYVTLEFASEHPIPIEDVPAHVLEATDMARLPHFLPRLKLDPSLNAAAKEAIAVLASDPTATARALDVAAAAAVRGRKRRPTTCALLVKAGDVSHMDAPLPTQDVRAERLGVAAKRDPEGPETFDIVVVVQAAPGRGLGCQ